MKSFILTCSLLWLTCYSMLSLDSFTNSSSVISSGGNLSANSVYQNFSVIGESVVSSYISNNQVSGSLGFIFQGEDKAFAPPLKTVLLFPPNNTVLPNTPANPITLVFYWVSQNEASYRLQVSRDSNFSNKLLDTVVSINYFSHIISNTGDLFWRVQTSKGIYYADWSEIWKFNLLLTDVKDEKEKEPSVFVFPNPANNYINLMISEKIQNHYIEITDVLGKVRFSTNAEINNMQIDISNFEEGVYFIRVGNKLSKFVKM